MMELVAALLGALVGGLATLVGSVVVNRAQLRKAMRGGARTTRRRRSCFLIGLPVEIKGCLASPSSATETARKFQLS